MHIPRPVALAVLGGLLVLPALEASAAPAKPAPPAAPAPAPARTSASGHGGYTVQDDAGNDVTRQFSFSATTQKDGTVNGSAVIQNPAFDFHAHIAVSCLRVDGNRATFGGVVTSSNDPFFTSDGDGFDRAFFTVVDNGEPGTTDSISAVYFDDVVGPDACQLTGPDDFAQTTIENGNVQVRNR